MLWAGVEGCIIIFWVSRWAGKIYLKIVLLNKFVPIFPNVNFKKWLRDRKTLPNLSTIQM